MKKVNNNKKEKSFWFYLYLIYPLSLVLQRGTKSFVCIIQRAIVFDLSKLKLTTPSAGEEHMPILLISRTVNCVWLCHVILLLHVHTCACVQAVCAGNRESTFLGFTPFHSVVHLSIFALIIHPENTEGGKSMSSHKPLLPDMPSQLKFLERWSICGSGLAE